MLVKNLFLLQKFKDDGGLTLIELMIVVAIIGVLGALAVPQYRNYIATAQYTVIIDTLQTIDREAKAFNISNGRYPYSLAEIGLPNIKDPWGTPYQYLNISTVTGVGALRKDHSLVPVNTDFDLYSMGPDKDSMGPFTAKVSRDDIVRANNGGYFGRVSDY